MNLSNTKKLYIKRTAFALLIILTAVLQSTRGAIFSPGGVHAMVLVPLTVSIAMHEKSVPTLLFGTFAGIMWDMSSITTDGFFSAVLLSIAFFVCVLVMFAVRNNIYSCLLLSFVSLLLCNTLYWLFFIVLKGYDSAVYIYFRYYFSSVFYSLLFVPIYYYIVRAISLETAPERKRINY